MKDNSIAFIGSGNMAAALIGGLVADGTDPTRIIAADQDRAKAELLAQRLGIRVADDNQAAASQAQVVVLAVKPQVLRSVAEALAATVQRHKPLVISIAAGVRSDTLDRWLGGHTALVRCMPNTPAMLQAGATGLYATRYASEPQRQLAESILRAVGLTRWVDEESLLDAVTAVSGSGPAYFFLVMEAMEQTARDLGLDSETARLLTLQTALGAARMALESSDDPTTLRQKVTSPGGTTEQAILSFEKDGLHDLFQRAMRAAHERSAELSRLLDQSSEEP